jgi:hypothetical protein
VFDGRSEPLEHVTRVFHPFPPCKGGIEWGVFDGRGEPLEHVIPIVVDGGDAGQFLPGVGKSVRNLIPEGIVLESSPGVESSGRSKKLRRRGC